MLTISQFSKAAQISPKTLRYYDEIKLLSPKKVATENNYRYYSIEQLAETVLIHRLKSYDCSLAEIKQALAQPDQLAEILQRKHTEIFDKMQHYQELHQELATDLENLAQGGTFMSYQEEIEIVTTSPMQLLSVRETINIKNFGELMQKLLQHIQDSGVTPVGAPMAFYHSDEYTPENYDLELAVPIAETDKATRVLPAYRCGRLIFKGIYHEMPAVYAALSTWQEKNNYTLITSPFEIYQTDPSETKPTENQVDVYFPIEEI